MTRHPSFGATLGVDWDGGTGYATIGQVRDIEGPNLSRNDIEVPPDHDQASTADNFMLHFPGVSDAGQVTFPINLDPKRAAHVGAAGTGLLGSFTDTYNGTSLPRWQYQNTGMEGGTATWVFRGYVAENGFNMGAVEGSMEAEITVQISGKPTLTVS